MCEFQLRSIRVQQQARLDFAAEVKAELQQQIDTQGLPEVDPLVELFGEPISIYTRRQAIEDGVLVQLSGDDYEGDGWIPEMVAEAGFRFPIAMTVASFLDCVAMTKGAEAANQDIQGRLWDVLWMLKNAISRHRGPSDLIKFQLHCSIEKAKPELVKLKAVCGPGDDGEPVITIMFPWED